MSEDSAARRTYNMWVGVEFPAIFIGMGALGGTGHTEFMPAWALLVVGLHFIPCSPRSSGCAPDDRRPGRHCRRRPRGRCRSAGAFPAPTLAGGLGTAAPR